jgi:hypothetical protein
MILNQGVVGISELFITNTTYAYLSMKNGDPFSKQFGGPTGNDPDFFLLTIKKYLNGVLSSDSVNFYLADFRFEDNSQDYIVNTWESVDLSGLGEADSLYFALSSSDVGAFGMNTPAYFCIDNVTASSIFLSTASPQLKLFDVYPNPSADYITVNRIAAEVLELDIYDTLGRLVFSESVIKDQQQIDLTDLFSGSYVIKLTSKGGSQSKMLIKN